MSRYEKGDCYNGFRRLVRCVSQSRTRPGRKSDLGGLCLEFFTLTPRVLCFSFRVEVWSGVGFLILLAHKGVRFNEHMKHRKVFSLFSSHHMRRGYTVLGPLDRIPTGRDESPPNKRERSLSCGTYTPVHE